MHRVSKEVEHAQAGQVSVRRKSYILSKINPRYHVGSYKLKIQKANLEKNKSNYYISTFKSFTAH